MYVSLFNNCLYIYIKEKTTSWIISSICHAENMNSSLSSNRELHKLSIIKLIKIWLGLTSCHGNIRVSHTCCFFPLLLLTPTPCSWPLDAVCTCSSNAYFLSFGISILYSLASTLNSNTAICRFNDAYTTCQSGRRDWTAADHTGTSSQS